MDSLHHRSARSCELVHTVIAFGPPFSSKLGAAAWARGRSSDSHDYAVLHATWQKCRIHVLRNLSYTPRRPSTTSGTSTYSDLGRARRSQGRRRQGARPTSGRRSAPWSRPPSARWLPTRNRRQRAGGGARSPTACGSEGLIGEITDVVGILPNEARPSAWSARCCSSGTTSGRRMLPQPETLAAFGHSDPRRLPAVGA
jgi:hypothetical protein